MSTTQTANYTISTERAQMQPERIHQWLSTHSYWAKGIPREIVDTTIAHSCCVGVFHEGLQVGFARFVTDYAVFAYLADVYVEPAHRGQGLSKRMVEALMGLPFVSGLRRVMLATRDAHGLYEQFDFVALQHPDRLMEIVRPNIYQTS